LGEVVCPYVRLTSSSSTSFVVLVPIPPVVPLSELPLKTR